MDIPGEALIIMISQKLYATFISCPILANKERRRNINEIKAASE